MPGGICFGCRLTASVHPAPFWKTQVIARIKLPSRQTIFVREFAQNLSRDYLRGAGL